MIDVIEINASNGQIPKLLKCRNRFDVREHSCLRLERKRNKSGKTAGLILQFAELTQMIDAMSKRLDVPIKHRTSAAAAHFVPGAMNIEPFGRGFFPATDFVADDRVENFRAATSNRTKPGFAQSLQSVLDRHVKNSLSEMTNLDGSKGFYVKGGIKSAQPSDKIEIPILF